MSKLKRRRVVRVALIYGAVAYAVLEAADLVIPTLQLPEWLLSVLVITALVGFPIAIALSWLFDVTPDGIVRTRSTTPEQGPSIAWFSTGSIVILCGAAVAVAAGWWLTGATRAAGGGSGAEAIRSIAVLPFTNFGESSEDDYFADGLGDELRALLRRVSGLDVAAGTSSRRFGSRDDDLLAIAEGLGVGAVLKGSVEKGEDRVRVVAELLSADEGGAQLWNAEYERLIDDIFEVQSEIAGSIVEALQLRLPQDEPSPMDAVVETNSMAYDKYLWGLFNHNRRTEAGARDAIDNFQMSIGFDSAYAPAWTGLAESLAQALKISPGLDPALTIDSGLAAAHSSVALDPESAEARTALAFFFQQSYDWFGAEAELELALEADPTSPLAHLRYAELMIAVEEPERAVAQVRTAVRADALSVPVRRTAARVLSAAGRIDEAIAEAQQALQLAPDDVDSWTEMGFIFLAAERFEDARNAFDRVVELTGRDPRIVGALMEGAEAFATTGIPAEVPTGLDELAAQDPVRLSMYLAALGRGEAALTALRRAMESHLPDLASVLALPSFRPV